MFKSRELQSFVLLQERESLCFMKNMWDNVSLEQKREIYHSGVSKYVYEKESIPLK